MLRTWTATCVLAIATGAPGSESAPKLSSTEVFKLVQQNVIRQLKQSTNYTCTEVLDRSFYYVKKDAGPVCSGRNESTPKTLYTHDRLRLDVAVSDGGEIFSWRGGEKFSSAGIESIVKTGAVSSGSFIGYLNNIFARKGVAVFYSGEVSNSTGSTHRFTYNVPLASSNYHVQVGSGRVIAPFHGAFTVQDGTFQLASLDVIMDEPPQRSNVCSARMSIHYQLVEISNQDSLIPKDYLLELSLTGERFSASRTSFTDCHAFQGESVIHYTDLDEGQASQRSAGPPRNLPEGLKIHAALSTPVTDTSFTGDPVEAILMSPVRVSKTDIAISKGAKLKGVISKLECHYEPVPHYILGVVLDSIADGPVTYRINGLLRTSLESKLAMVNLYRVPYGKLAPDDPDVGGQFVFLGKNFHTPRNLSATWITTRTASE